MCLQTYFLSFRDMVVLHIIVMITDIDLSQKIFVIDMFVALNLLWRTSQAWSAIICNYKLNQPSLGIL